MIYIDLNNFSPHDDWSYEAWQLKNELLSIPLLTDKFAFIDANRLFWGRIKADLPYSEKCWYSESKESVSVYEIEHFRPTRAICRSINVYRKIKPNQEQNRADWTKANKYKCCGYWWLAFEYRNFRNCGKRINNIKGIRFPLNAGSYIASNHTDDYQLEDVALLDPTNPADPLFLTFDPDGKARPTIVDQNRIEFVRAFISIEIYGLNSIDSLVKHRESKWSECYKAIKRAGDKYLEIEMAANAGDEIAFSRYFNEFMDFIDNDIKPAINPRSEFSSVAKACVMSYSALEWVGEYILN